MMRIQDFPRPQADNGRGLHWSASLYHPTGSELDFWIDELRAMNIKWVKLLDDGGGSSLELCQRLREADIMPIVRMWRDRPNPGHLEGRQVDAVRRLIQHGVRYFETNNEPDLPAEWQHGSMPDNWLEIVLDNFIWDANRIIDMGGLPALPAMGPGSKENPIGVVVGKGHGDLFENGAWVAIHNYTLNHPLDYPDDDVNQQGRPLTPEEYEECARWAHSGLTYEEIIALGVALTPQDYYKFSNWAWDWRSREMVNEVRARNANPGQTIFDDPNCFRAWEVAGKMIVDALGFHVPVISTEGGTVMGWGDDNRYAKVNSHTQMAWQLEIARFMREEAPPWYIACCTWLIAANRMDNMNPTWEQMAWYTNAWDLQFGLQGELPIVQVLKDQGVGKGVIEGTIRTAAGRAVAALPLRLSCDGTEVRTGETGAEGAFRFQDLVAGRYSLDVVGHGLVQEEIELAEENPLALHLWLGAGSCGIINALVSDTAGEKRSGVTVTLLGTHGLVGSEVSDSAGRVRFTNLGAGIYRLQADGVTVGGIVLDGWGGRTEQLIIPAPIGFHYAVAGKRLLSPEETGNRRILYGFVVNASGEPLDGVEIAMSWLDAEAGTEFPRTTTGKDPFQPDGYYEFLHTAGEFQLKVTEGDWESEVADGLLTVNVPGREGDTITYEVNFRLQSLGEPPAGCTVEGVVPGLPAGRRLILQRGEESWITTVDSEARFAFPELLPGSYSLEMEGLGRIAESISLAEGDCFRLTFPMEAVLEGQAKGGQLPLVAYLHADRWDWTQRAMLDADGRFRLSQLPPGAYRLELSGQELTDLWVTGPDTLTLFVIELEGAVGSSVRGCVVDADGMPLADVVVQLMVEGTNVAETRTAVGGAFAFSGLSAGTYELLVAGQDVSCLVTVDGVNDVELADVLLPAEETEKAIAYYLLFGQPSAGGTRTNLLLAQEVLRRSGATAGFSVSEAAQAQRVIIVGDESAVSAANEATLRKAGCKVARLDGDSYVLEQLLAELAQFLA